MSRAEAPPWELLLTCEHGGNAVPARYRGLFADARGQALLASHRGWDPGALTLARRLARALGAPLLASRTTRLLCDLNRSEGHPRLYSERTRDLPAAERERILAFAYRPHRARVERHLAVRLKAGRAIVHVGVHSFTPVLDGEVRQADVGLLYDPARPGEAAFAGRWRVALGAADPRLRVRRNYPYRGAADGLTTSLRRRLPPGRYLGLELEVNQAFPTGVGVQAPEAPSWRAVQAAIERSLREALGGLAGGRKAGGA